jgi:hypothetical protein
MYHDVSFPLDLDCEMSVAAIFLIVLSSALIRSCWVGAGGLYRKVGIHI